MVFSRYIVRSICLFLFTIAYNSSIAQLGFDLDIKKPEPYDNRELKSEKTTTGKLKAPQRFFQNTYTHYNYFFNSKTKLNNILDRAKEAHRDNYATLLPFYNYSLSVTAQDSIQLDSVIYKAKTGIVLHDLRNDWIDDLYLLWGVSYYLRQQFDSAYQMFQFINYAFAEKEKDGYYKYIGSPADGAKTTSIVTKENEGYFNKMVADPPSRNIALIWLARTQIQRKQYAQAGSLLALLEADPLFPDRLKGSLAETQAFWFYRQNMWDSAGSHLIAALGEAKNKQERARWEYLAGQLFERSNQFDNAATYYSKAIGHTTDPVLDIYARLNLVRINKEGGDNYIDKNIEVLLKMAKKDKYLDYRDVIYSMAAQMEIERQNFDAAQQLLAQAAKFRTDNSEAKNSAYMQLANLAYDRHDYIHAASYYDSINIQEVSDAEIERLIERKTNLSRLIAQLNVIQRQDSLQRIASLPEEERDAIVKKMVRQLRKQQGLKDEEPGKIAVIAGPSTDAFANQQPKGDWYFYNASLKTAGASTFKQVWGNRPNVDNWRRQSEVTAQLNRNNSSLNSKNGISTSGPADNTANSLSYESLVNQLPLTADAIQRSNDSIAKALFSAGSMYVNQLEDYSSAASTFEQLRSRFKEGYDEAQALFHLYYSYIKIGEIAKANNIKSLLTEKYPNSRYASILTTGKDPQSAKPREDITKTYEGIYDMYLEGKFTEAQEAKRKADSIYHTNYWSPQLLYIEAVYHIKQREDSVAQEKLAMLIELHGSTPIGAKAKNLSNVLSRRKEIETELTNLQIESPKEDTLYVEPMPTAPNVVKKETVSARPKDSIIISQPVSARPVVDTTTRKPAITKPGSLFSFKPDAQQYVAVILNKVDVVFVNEAKNAFNRYNKEQFYNLPLDANLVSINDDIKVVLIGVFSNAQGALDYIQKTKPVAATEIVPWLKGGKFTFSLISDENLRVVTETKEFDTYQKFLEQNLPVKF